MGIIKTKNVAFSQCTCPVQNPPCQHLIKYGR
ncbi:SWIM zinc finger family protein [Bacillus amyloliquefaciens]